MPVANSQVLETDLGDELVLMHPSSGQMFSLNASGRLLWRSLPASEAALAQCLMQHYGIGQAQAEADVRTLLAALQARDLINA